MIAGSSCQGRSMNEYINIIWKLHVMYLLQYFAPEFCQLFLLQVKSGNKFDYFLILAKLVCLDLAYVW